MLKKLCLVQAVFMLSLILIPFLAYAETGTDMIIPVNFSVMDNLSNRSEKDIFRFTLKEPGSVQVRFEYPSDARTYTWGVSLNGAGSNGKIDMLQYSSNKDSGDSIYATKTMYLNKTRLPAGDYYIKVECSSEYSNFSNADYSVTVLFTPEPGSGFEKEYNDTARTANKINTNSPCTGNLSSNTDVDWYRVTLDKAGSLQVKFDYPADARGFTWAVGLHEVDSGGTLELLEYSQNRNTDESVSATKTLYLDKTRLPAGDYYIKVEHLLLQCRLYTYGSF